MSMYSYGMQYGQPIDRQKSARKYTNCGVLCGTSLMAWSLDSWPDLMHVLYQGTRTSDVSRPTEQIEVRKICKHNLPLVGPILGRISDALT
jgi:hypothetical protein